MGWKDILPLVFGFFLGIPASMIASLVMGPLMTILSSFRTVRALASLRRRVVRDQIFDEYWVQTWFVESANFDKENVSSIRLHRFLHLLAGEAEMSTAKGAKAGFRVLGTIENNRVITGKWMDPHPGGYYGTFQLILAPMREKAEGKWVGFSAGGTVKSGRWMWSRSADRG
jgi:hypothetical protein